METLIEVEITAQVVGYTCIIYQMKDCFKMYIIHIYLSGCCRSSSSFTL